MNTRSILFAAVLAVITAAASSQKLSTTFTPKTLSSMLSPEAVKSTNLKVLSAEIAKVEQAVINNGCDTNLCFALQGGSDVNDKEYKEQKNFIDIVLQIIATDDPANFAAVQYATKEHQISALDSRRNRFLRRLRKSSRKPGGTNIVSGIRYCAKQIRPKGKDLDKMVLLSNGFATVGSDQVTAARRFLNDGGHICAITVGPSDRKALLKITKSNKRILKLNQWFELSEIIVDLVRQVCRLP